MSKLKTNTIQHTGGSADNITLDNSQNVTVENNLTVDGTSTLTGNVTASGNLIANGKVGIGNDTSYASGDADDLIIGTTSGSANHGLTILSPTNKNAGIYFSDGDNPNGAHRGYFDYNHTTDALNIGTAGAQKVVINSAGSISVPSGQGIDFSATGDGSGTDSSELFSDYEEGTFSPVIKSGSNTISVSGGGESHKYVKIGNMVFLQSMYDGVTTSGTTQGALKIEGLPYAPASNVRRANGNVLWHSGGFRGNGWPAMPHIQTTHIEFYYKESYSDSYSSVAVNNVGGSSYFFWSCRYETT